MKNKLKYIMPEWIAEEFFFYTNYKPRRILGTLDNLEKIYADEKSFKKINENND